MILIERTIQRRIDLVKRQEILISPAVMSHINQRVAQLEPIRTLIIIGGLQIAIIDIVALPIHMEQTAIASQIEAHTLILRPIACALTPGCIVSHVGIFCQRSICVACVQWKPTFTKQVFQTGRLVRQQRPF